MVKTVLSLRYTITVHQLRREWWRMLVVIGGAVWSVSLFPSVAWASARLADEAPSLRYTVLVAVLAVFMLGWVIVPILVTGVDDSLEPSRFATLGVSARRLMPGLTVSAMLTIPAMFFFATLVILALSWRDDGARVLAIALAGAFLGFLTLVLSARVAVMWSARVLQSRRSREAVFVALLIGALLITPVVYLLVADGLDTVLQYDVRLLIDLLGGTPVGAPVQAAVEATRGNWSGAFLNLAVSAVWVVLLHWVWRVNVARVLVNPVSRGGGTREREDSILAAAIRGERRAPSSHSVRARRAVTSRALRYWFTDARYLANLVSVTAFPLLFFMLVYPIFGSPLAILIAVPVVLAGSIGWGRHNDLAYDNTALWLDVVAGKMGREVMTGRVLAVLSWGLPLTLAAVAVSVIASGRTELLPAVAGAALGVLGTSLAVSAVTAVALPYRAPAPGENPFAAEVGSIGASLGSQLLSSIVSWSVAIPVSIPLALAVRVDSGWGWVGIVTGPATGIAALWFALRWAGRLYDRRSGRLVGAVS